jgi:hypothetical protein
MLGNGRGPGKGRGRRPSSRCCRRFLPGNARFHACYHGRCRVQAGLAQIVLDARFQRQSEAKRLLPRCPLGPL